MEKLVLWQDALCELITRDPRGGFFAQTNMEPAIERNLEETHASKSRSPHLVQIQIEAMSDCHHILSKSKSLL